MSRERENDEYTCALSGVTAEPGDEDDSDNLGDLPVAWTRITFTRRQYNPEYILIQQAKERILEALLEQFPPEMREAQRTLFEIQVRAQFKPLEDDVPQYLPDVEDTLDCSDDDDVTETLNQIREQLGLEPMPELDDDEPEEGEEEEEDK